MADKSQDFRIGLTWDETGANAVDRALAEFQNRQMQRAEQYLMASEAQSKRLIAARQQQLQQINDLEEKAHATSVANLERLVQRQDAIRARARKMQEEADRAMQGIGMDRGVQGRGWLSDDKGSGFRSLYSDEAAAAASEYANKRLAATRIMFEEERRLEEQLDATRRRTLELEAQRQNFRVATARTAIGELGRLEEQLAQVKARAAAAAAKTDFDARNQRLANARSLLQEMGRLETTAANERARFLANWDNPQTTRRGGTLLNSNMGGRHGRGVGWDFLGGESFRTIGFQMRAIPGGGVAETLGRLAPLADVMAELSTGTSAAGASVLGLVGGLVAFGVVLNATITGIQQTTDAFHRMNEAARQFRREARGKSTEDIQSRLREIDIELTQRNKDYELLQSQFVEAQDAAMRSVAGLGALTLPFTGSAAHQAVSAFSELNMARDQESEAILRLTQEQYELNKAMIEGANAYPEATAEIKRLLGIQEMTQAERDAEIKKNRRTIDTLQYISMGGGLSSEEMQAALDWADALERRNAQLSTAGTTIADLIGDEEALAAARKQVFEDQVALRLRIQGMTQSERDERIREIEDEIAMWQRMGDARKGDIAVQEAVGEATQALNRELSELRQTVWTTADAVQAASLREESLSSQTDMLFEEQTNLGEALERVREATEAYNEALADHQERLAEIDAEAQEKREEAYADAADDFAEAEEDAQKKREEQEKEHRDRIAEINRKADRDIANAIANRDALAAYLAEQQRQDDLADEAARHKDQLEQIEEAYDDQKKAIQKRLDEQLEDIEKAAAKARATEQKRFAEQARDLQAAIDKQRSMVQLAEARLDQIRSGFMSGRVIKEYDHQNKLYNIAVAAQDAMLFRTQYFWNAMVDTIKVPGALARSGGGGTVARMGAMIDRRVDVRLNDTFRAAERILIQ